MQPTQGDLSMVTLVLKDDLSAASDFFYALLNNDKRENREGIILLQQITETVMKDVLKFMRSGHVTITQENAEALIEAADYLLLPKLKTIAGRFLGDQELSAWGCLSRYYFGQKYQCEDLVLTSRKFIFSNFADVAESQEFLDLESQQVEQWICRDEIAVKTEEDVFETILNWIAQDKNKRKVKFEELFRLLRLEFMSRKYLCRYVVTTDLVKQNSNCMKLVRDALNGIYCTSSDHPQLPRKYLGTHLVVFTGKETLCYQLEKDEWYRLADAPLRKNEGCMLSASFKGKLYVFPKSPYPYSNFAVGKMYDPSLNSWTEITLTLQQNISREAVAVVAGEMYSLVIDGSDNSQCFISKYIRRKNRWEACTVPEEHPFPTGACVVAKNSCLYVLGGYLSVSDHMLKTPTRKAWRFSIIRKRWESIADMKVRRYNACDIAARGKIFVAGGIRNTDDRVAQSPCNISFDSFGRICVMKTDSCEVYDVEANEWQLMESLNAPCSGGSMVYLRGTLYMVGGDKLTVESYDFIDQKWKRRTEVPILSDLSRRSEVCTLNVPSIPFMGTSILLPRSHLCALV